MGCVFSPLADGLGAPSPRGGVTRELWECFNSGATAELAQLCLLFDRRVTSHKNARLSRSVSAAQPYHPAPIGGDTFPTPNHNFRTPSHTAGCVAAQKKVTGSETTCYSCFENACAQWRDDTIATSSLDAQSNVPAPAPALQGCLRVVDQTFQQYLVSVGFPPVLAAVTPPEMYVEDRDNAWREMFRKQRAQYRAEYRHEGLDSQTGPNPLAGRLHERMEAAGLIEQDVPNRTQLLDELDLSLDADEDRFRIFGAPQLNSSQFNTRYLIPGILTACQPGGLFGAFKTLKTSLTADLLISLASGTPFLDHFPVAESGPTLFLSGESGLAALPSSARRSCTARAVWSGA